MINNMRKIKNVHLGLIALSILMLIGCTEQVDIADQLVFEDAIVVEATITNETKKHRILITRTYKFEDNGPSPESNAQVTIIEGDNNTIHFTEESPGWYVSDDEFKAINGVEYQLSINTQGGGSYLSGKMVLSKPGEIDEVYATREINSFGTEIMSINVDSYDPENESHYYRYTYEETYKIIAPSWVHKDFILQAGPYPAFGERPIEEQVCYNTIASNSIIQTSTTQLMEDKVSKFSVRSIAADDPILRDRYSIIVKQYIQSLEAYSYYDILNQLSGTGSLFSQIQPGFINSNILSLENKNEKVLGFFEVSSVSEKRIFVNYDDVFPGEPIPPYYIGCEYFAPQVVNMGATPLRNAIEGGQIKYYTENLAPEEFEGPYNVVARPCGDCTVYGTSEKPYFWED